MRKYMLIGLGGFLGAVLRYAVKNWPLVDVSDTFPVNIFIINITGCLALAFLLRLTSDIWKLDTDYKTGITTGFLGAFTTFSTFCRDFVGLVLENHIYSSIVYLLLSVVLGLAAIYLGELGAGMLVRITCNPIGKRD